jgi:plasmid stability protein
VSDILVRGLPPEVVETLKERARRHNRSLQAEVRDILQSAAGAGLSHERVDAFLRVTDEIRRRSGPQSTDSVELIRQERDDRSR